MVRFIYRVTWVCDLQYGALTCSNTVSSILERVIKKSILLAYFRNSEQRNCQIRDPLFFLFVNRARVSQVPPFQNNVRVILPPYRFASVFVFFAIFSLFVFLTSL